MNPLLPRLPESTLWQQSEFLRQRIEAATKAQVRSHQLSPAAWRYAQTQLFGRVAGRLELANPEDERHFEFDLGAVREPDGTIAPYRDREAFEQASAEQHALDVDEPSVVITAIDAAAGTITMLDPRAKRFDMGPTLAPADTYEITLANVADGYVRIDDETVSPMFVPGQRLVDSDGHALGTVVSVDVARGVLTMRRPRP